MTNREYHRMTYLQYQVKALTRRVEAFESGAVYTSMREDYRKMLQAEEGTIRKLKHEVESAHDETRKVRKIWEQTNDDVIKDCNSQLAEKDRELARMQKRIHELMDQRDEAKEKSVQLRHELYEAQTRIEELEGQNHALHAQINRDYENSSKPSSQSPNHKKIQNNRESTGRKPGGQKGHEHHGRQKQTPTESHHIEAEQYILDDPDFVKTGDTITKQLINIHILIETKQYTVDIYRNYKTGEWYHAPFPAGLVDDVNYGGTVKAFLYSASGNDSLPKYP